MLCKECKTSLRMFESRIIGNNRIRLYVCPKCKKTYKSWERLEDFEKRKSDTQFKVLVVDENVQRLDKLFVYRMIRFWLPKSIKIFTKNKNYLNYDLILFIDKKKEDSIKYKNRIYLTYTNDILYKIRESILKVYSKRMADMNSVKEWKWN